MKARCIYGTIDMTMGRVYDVGNYDEYRYSFIDDVKDERLLSKGYFELLVEENAQEKFNQVKTNKIKYKTCGGKESRLEYNVENNNITLKINGRFNVMTLLRILLQEVDCLNNFKYKRISPYKIKRERAKNREDRSHLWIITFMDVKDENKIKTSEIIKATVDVCLESGEYSYFIPDLLEVAAERGLVSLEGDMYIRSNKLINSVISLEYIDNSFSRESLINKGWIVPTGYMEV